MACSNSEALGDEVTDRTWPGTLGVCLVLAGFVGLVASG